MPERWPGRTPKQSHHGKGERRVDGDAMISVTVRGHRPSLPNHRERPLKPPCWLLLISRSRPSKLASPAGTSTQVSSGYDQPTATSNNGRRWGSATVPGVIVRLAGRNQRVGGSIPSRRTKRPSRTRFLRRIGPVESSHCSRRSSVRAFSAVSSAELRPSASGAYTPCG